MFDSAGNGFKIATLMVKSDSKLIESFDEVTSAPRAEPVAAIVTWSSILASGAERSIMSPLTLVVWKEKPDTGDVEGGPRTPSTVNRIADPAVTSSETFPLKNTWSKSVVSPCVNSQANAPTEIPDTAAHGTTPGEVEVETNDSSSVVWVSKLFHFGKVISTLPSLGISCTAVNPTVRVEYSPTV